MRQDNQKSLRVQWLEEEMTRMHLLANKLEAVNQQPDKVVDYHRRIWDHQEEYKIRTGDYYHAVYKKKQ
jgi:hypothetical protein